MNRREEEAIVLESSLSGEADRQVRLLLGSGEILRATAPAAARSRRRFGAGLQPGARVRVRYSRKRENAEAVLEEALLLAPPPPPDPGLERYYLAAHALEISGAFAREGALDPRLFRLLAAVLERLREGDAPDPLARYLEAWTLRLAGLLPEIDLCHSCGASLTGKACSLVPEEGLFCDEHAPRGGHRLGREAGAWLQATRHRPPGDLPPLSGSAGAALARALPACIVSFTGRPLCAWPALLKLRRRAAGEER